MYLDFKFYLSKLLSILEFIFIAKSHKHCAFTITYVRFGNRRLVSLVGKAPIYRAGGSGSIPDRTNTQGRKIIEENVLPLL